MKQGIRLLGSRDLSTVTSSQHVRLLPAMSSNSTDALAYRRNEDRASYGVPITIVCPIIALILVVLRIYSRAFLVRKVFWEDYLIVAAMASSISVSVLIVIAFSNGNGRHYEIVSIAEFTRLRKISPGIYITYATTHALAKLSIVFQYIRICVMNFEKRFCYALFAILSCGFLAFLIAAFLSKIFRGEGDAIWTPNVPGAVCLNATASFTANQVYLIIMDFTILIGPFFILRHLTIPWPQRVLLGFIMSLGATACIVSVLRLQVIYRSTTSTDRTWDAVPSGLYAIIEINVGIACSCVVTLRPLFSRWRWLSNGGKAKPPQAITPTQKPPRPMDPFSVGTGSTQVLTESDDMELGAVHAASIGGSTRAGSRAGEDGEAAPPAWPAPPPAAQCQSATLRCRSDDGQHHQQTSVTESSHHPDPSHPRSPVTQPGDK
ncbi:hypothetical protein RB595_008805 [Gaeumannomyces hyphopodioides]